MAIRRKRSTDLVDLTMDLSFIQAHSAAAEKVAEGVTEFETYIRKQLKVHSELR